MDYAINLLLWALPVGLIFLIIYRFQNSHTQEKNETDNEVGKKKRRKGLSILGYVVFSILIVFFTLLIINTDSYPKPRIHPDEFREVIDKDVDRVANLFQKKKFKTVKGFTGKIPTYTFQYFKGKEVVESCWVITNALGYIGYGIKSEESYENYFNYLIEIGGENLGNTKYNFVNTDWNFSLNHGPIYKYKNCIFVQYGYSIENDSYVIQICNFDNVKEF